MIKNGNFYVNGSEVVCFEVREIMEGDYIWFISTVDSYDESDSFKTAEDALANLLVVLNEG